MSFYTSPVRQAIDQLKSSEDIEEILKTAKVEAVLAAFSEDDEKFDHWAEVCDVATEVLEAPSLNLQTSLPRYAMTA